MVFYFYEEAMKEVAKISVDGLVPKSLHLSHWIGNETPKPFKADTATEIVFRYLASPKRKEIFPQVGIITNNHFDTDGLLSVWTLLNPRRAEPMRDRLVASAEAGDFSFFASEEGVQINYLIKALAYSAESPLREEIDIHPGPREARYYKWLLPMVFDLFREREKPAYRALWGPPFQALRRSMARFDQGLIGFEEYEIEGLSLVIDEVSPAPEAIDHYCHEDLFMIVEDKKKSKGGYGYTLAYRYYAWAETVTRPPIPMRPMETLAAALNARETAGHGEWMTTGYPGGGLTTALKFTDAAGSRCFSRLAPEAVLDLVLSHLRETEARRAA